MQVASRVVVDCADTKAALETALLDLVGKTLGVPVSTLLGGAVRKTIPLSCSIANPDFNADIALAEQLREHGVHIVKFKAGTHMIAATPAITLGCEFYHARFYLEEDLLAEPFPIAEGEVVVPSLPGLGVEVDLAKVRSLSVSSVRHE